MSGLNRKERELVRSGARDEAIKKTVQNQKKFSYKFLKTISTIIESLFSLVLLALIAASLYTTYLNNDIQLFDFDIKVVATDSMAEANPRNEYLAENNLTNQFSANDIIFFSKLPAESDLKLYDIVSYFDETNDRLIVHRIIDIIETSEGNQFVLRGDANRTSDSRTILYSDLRAIYNGQKIEGLGLVVKFIQSPFALIAMAVMVYVLIIDSIFQKKLKQLDKSRYQAIKQREALLEERAQERNEKKLEEQTVKHVRSNSYELVEKDKKFGFRLYDSNGYLLVTSAFYQTEEIAEQRRHQIADMVKKKQYEIYKDSRGFHQIKLYTGNKRLMFVCEPQNSLRKAKLALKELKMLALGAKRLIPEEIMEQQLATVGDNATNETQIILEKPENIIEDTKSEAANATI